MLLSSNVIKKVSHQLENCSVHPRVQLAWESQEGAAPSTPELRLIDVEAARAEAEKLLAEARDEAELLLQQTRAKISAWEEAAYTQGHQQGEQAAREAWEQAWNDFRLTSVSIFNELEKLRANLFEETEAELLDLAVTMAEKLVCRQLNLHPDTILDIVKTACDQARDCKEVTVYVPAAQLESILAKQGEIDAHLYKTEHFAIRSDPNMDCGGCRVETEQGYIDAGLDTMAEQLRQLLKDDDSA